MSPPDNVGSAHAWRRYADLWRDVWLGPVIVVMAMVAVGVGTLTVLLDGGEPTALAWMNGIAAIVTSVAALAEARKGRDRLVDHEVRIRVLENGGPK